MILEADIHRRIRQNNGSKEVFYESPVEDIPELPGINVSFISVLRNIPEGFRRGAYVMLRIDAQSVTSDIIDKVGMHMVRRFSPEDPFPFAGWKSIGDCINVQMTNYQFQNGRVFYPIYKIRPAVYNPENDRRDANN